MKLPFEPEFEDQAPRMLRKDKDALENTLLDMRGLWYGSKINMSLASKRKIWLPREKGECLSLTDSVKCQNSLPREKTKGKGWAEHEIAGFWE
ncbi:unnamed protein product [Prunus armeniaca]